MKPSAMAPTVCFFPVAFEISCFNNSNLFMVPSISNGAFPLGPKTFGKYSGRSLPKITLQSVIVSGPLFP